MNTSLLTTTKAALMALVVLAVSALTVPAFSQAPASPPPAPPPASPPAPAPEPALITTPEERADALHLQAKPLLDANQWEQAVVLLEEAYKLKPSHDIAANYGVALFGAERFREAAEAFRVAATKMPTDLPKEQRHKFELLNASARKEIAIVRVRVNATGATILIDGQPVGQSPIEHELFLDPGEHRFVAEKNGERTIEITRTVIRTDDKVIELGDLGASGGGVPKPAIGLIAAGGIVAAIGGALLISTLALQRSDYDDMAAQGGCGTPPALGQEARCAELEEIRKDNNTKVTAGWIAVGVGGAALIAGSIWAAVAASSDDDPPSAMLVPWITPEHQGLVLTGTF